MVNIEIRDVAPNIPIRMINMFEEYEEVKREDKFHTVQLTVNQLRRFS